MGGNESWKLSRRAFCVGVVAAFVLAIAPCAIVLGDEASLTAAARTLLEGGMARKKQLLEIPPLEIPLPEGQKLEMVLVRHGIFMMGKPGEYGCHQVEISHDYWIGRYEVTRKQFEVVMEQQDSWLNSDEGVFPKTGVKWNEANEFCRKLTWKYSKILPKGYYFSLPTEAQWEYAAGGGQYGARQHFSGGEQLDTVAWHGGNSAGRAHPVGMRAANELGLYDMTGNVSEWCLDDFSDYSPEPVVDPPVKSKLKLTLGGGEKVCRGGSYNSQNGFKCGVTDRDHTSSSSVLSTMGFRVVLVFDKDSEAAEMSAKQWTETMRKFGEIKNRSDFINFFRGK